MNKSIQSVPRLALRSALAALTVALSTSAAPLHEGDPKLLDRVPAYQGPGWRPGASVANGGAGANFVCGADSVSPVEFRADGIKLLSWVTLGELGGASGNDCWGYVSPSGREYALIGVNTGTGIVEITDPSSPTIVTRIDGPNSLWRDIKTYGHYAYSVSEGGGGIQVIDLEQVDTGMVTLVNEVTAGGTSETHNVAIDEESGFLYRCGGGSFGLRIYSLANPANPTFVRSWSDIYVHDAQVVTYTSGPYAGRQIAFVCGGFSNGNVQTRLDVLDVTDKNNIFLRSRVTWPQRAYGHQVWLSPDRQYAYINDELDENPMPTRTLIADVSDLDASFLAGTFTNDISAVGHNLYTRDNLIYEANYRSGLRIFDATDPLAPVEVRHFDTWPGNNHFGFNGLWSTYPYFPSGVVIGSDLEKGLFVLWAEDPLVEISFPEGIPLAIDSAGDSLVVQIDERATGDLEPGSAELQVASSAGCTTIPLLNMGGGAFRADFPASACGEELRWSISARSTNGITWQSPEGAPRSTHQSFSGQSVVEVFSDDGETDQGWILGEPEDTAVRGTWERSEPPGGRAAPTIDHSEVGTLCFHTSSTDDVDGGRTGLVTPRIDLSATENPRIDYWRWFSSRLSLLTNNERMRVEITGDDGANWTLVETVGTNNLESLLGWFQHGFFVRDLLEPTAEIRMRLRARDLDNEDLIEAALDDFRVLDVRCDCGQTTNVCSTSPNSAGSGALISGTGSTSVAAASFGLEVSGATPGGTGLFFYGPDSIQVPFGNGFRCVGGATARLFPTLALDGNGSGSYALDFSAPPVGSGPNAIAPGSTWFFQFWYRDNPAGGAGFNLSDALEASFCQ